LIVPQADNRIHFQITGPGEIVASDNGDPADLESILSKDRKTFNEMAIVIIRAGKSGPITISAQSTGLQSTQIIINGK